jgi:hypothetical protein
MPEIETAETIANLRTVTAAAVLENRADLRSYPYRYLAIHSYSMMRGQGVRAVMAAAEMVEQWGWQLVNIMETDKQIYGFMRRVG